MKEQLSVSESGKSREKKDWHHSMRGYFANSLYNEIIKDKNIFLITCDLGYKMFDHHFEDFPERTINVGAAELSAVAIGFGLAL